MLAKGRRALCSGALDRETQTQTEMVRPSANQEERESEEFYKQTMETGSEAPPEALGTQNILLAEFLGSKGCIIACPQPSLRLHYTADGRKISVWFILISLIGF